MRPLPRHGGALETSRPLELLVLTVSVLDPDRAASLLAGLGDPLQGPALRHWARMDRMGRAARHAALARACAVRPASGAARAADIPGVLGAEVRRRLAGEGTAPDCSGQMERWARRLVAELER